MDIHIPLKPKCNTCLIDSNRSTNLALGMIPLLFILLVFLCETICKIILSVFFGGK